MAHVLEAWAPLIFLPVFVTVWFAVGQLGGWGELARRYRATRRFEGRLWRGRSATIGRMTNYSGCLTFGADMEGLHIALPRILSLGHPALFFPWEDVTISPVDGRLFKYADLRFRRSSGGRVRIFRNLARQLLQAAGREFTGG